MKKRLAAMWYGDPYPVVAIHPDESCTIATPNGYHRLEPGWMRTSLPTVNLRVAGDWAEVRRFQRVWGTGWRRWIAPVPGVEDWTDLRDHVPA